LLITDLKSDGQRT